MRSLIIGSSGGIGAALVQELASRGEVVGLSRSRDGFDVTDEATVSAGLGALEGYFDFIFVASGALEIEGARPEKTVRALDPAAMAAQFAVNAMGPALIIKHAIRLLPKDRDARFGVLSARVGSIGDNMLGGWYSYRAAKAALNQVLRTAAIEVARSHPKAILAALHPGTVATSLTRPYSSGHPAQEPSKAAQNLIAVIESLSPAQSGCFFDWEGKVVAW